MAQSHISANILIDVDCFEVQLWKRIRSDLRGNEPTVTVNDSGIITSVSYEARALGVSKKIHNTFAAAHKICPNLQKIVIPNKFGKPDTKQTRLASYQIFDIIKDYCRSLKQPVLQSASKDEVFLDVTTEVMFRIYSGMNVTEYLKKYSSDRIFVEHSSSTKSGLEFWALNVHPDQQSFILMHTAIIAKEIIDKIRCETTKPSKRGFECSAGVAANKVLAKLACGMHKPQGITVLLPNGVKRVSRMIQISDIPGLGGKDGKGFMRHHNVTTMFQLSQMSLSTLVKTFGLEKGRRFHDFSKGIDEEKIEPKDMSREISCGKSFQGKRRITREGDIFQHLYILCDEMTDRCEEEEKRNNRKPVAFKLCILKGYKKNSLFTFTSKVEKETSDIQPLDIFDPFKDAFQKSTDIEHEHIKAISEIKVMAVFPAKEQETKA